MASCANCGAETTDLLMSGSGEVCRTCFDEVDKPSLGLTPVGMGAYIAGVIPFFVWFSVNGLDYVAVGGGGVAVGLGVMATVTANRNKQPRALWLGVGAIALGAYQLVRGLGLLA